MSREQIIRVDPAAAIPGGEVAIECADFDTSNLRECRARFDGVEARLVGVGPTRVLAIVPEGLEGGETEVVLESAAALLRSSAASSRRICTSSPTRRSTRTTARST